MNLDERTLYFLETTSNGEKEQGVKTIKFDMLIPEDVKAIADVFYKNNKELYVVGGAVRDAIRGEKIKDYDLATDAIPEYVESIMKEAGFKTIATGKAFGVINVFTGKGEYEISTFRADIGKGRRPDSVSFTNMEIDAKRRDLTINALFYDIEKKEIIDYVGGLEDIKNKVVKTVGFAVDRFDEDRLRILRAIRFAVRFNSKLSNTVNAALSVNSSLEGISNERIRDEFIKSIKSAKNINYLINLYSKYNLFPEILKGLKITTNEKISGNNPIIVLATLLNENNLNYLSKKLNELTYSSIEIRGIIFLIRLISINEDNINIINIKTQQKISYINDTDILTFAKIINLNLPFIRRIIEFKLSFNGNDVAQSYNLNGEQIGEKLLDLENQKFLSL